MRFTSDWRSTEPYASVLHRGGGSSTHAESLETAYTKKVAAAGLALDLAFISRGEIDRVRRAPPGRRNATLFRAAIELVRCGIDPTILIGYSVAGGLPVTEANLTVKKAQAAFSDQYGRTVLDFVKRWVDEWKPRFKSRLHPLLLEIAAAAVRQNNRSPLVVQSALDLGPFHQTTVTRWFSLLHERGAVVRKPRGRGPKGRKPNFYELRLPDPNE